MRCATVVVVLLSLGLLGGAQAGVKQRTSEKEAPAFPVATNTQEEPNAAVSEQAPNPDVTAPILVDDGAKPQNEKVENEDMKKSDLKEQEKEESEKPKVGTEDEKISYQGIQVVRVAIKNKEENSFIRSLETKGEVETWLNNGTAVDVVIRTPDTLKTLQNKNLKYEIVIDNLQRAIQEENPMLSEEEWTLLEGRKATPYKTRAYSGVGSTQNNLGTRFGYMKYTPVKQQLWRVPDKKKQRPKKKRRYRLTWQMYHRMADVHGYLDYLAATYPQNVTLTTIGQSVEGRPLKVLKFSSGKPNRPAIWVDAGIHAREWITPASLTYIISQMVEGGDGSRNVDWYFQPLVNPDGYEHSHSRDRLWRKNRAHPEKGSCAGIDLNRNFGYKWGGQGASKQPCRETFAGPGPFSEPETASIQKFIASKQGQIKGYVSLHSYGQYILYPWGYDRKVPADYQDLERVGRQMAAAIRTVGGQTYTVGAAANTLYPASGGSDDWAKGSAKIKYAYTLELRDTGRHGFVLPAQYIIPSAKDAYAALDVLAQELAK